MKRTSSIIGMILLAMVVVLPNAGAAAREKQEKQTAAKKTQPAAKAPKQLQPRGQISVFGTGSPSYEQHKLAQYVGFFAARRGYIVLNGGGGGVMESVSKGAKQGGGFVIGIMPGGSVGRGNRYLDLEIPTGLGELRNTVLAAAGNGAIAIGTTPGTTSEVAWALRQGKTVVAPKGHVQPFDGVHFVKLPAKGAAPEFLRLATTARKMVDDLISDIEKK
jgi:uncharacterized protein (TIGR00725 family)